MSNKTVLVTGGAGYIGSHTVLALREAGLEPVVLDNLVTGTREAVPADVPFVEGDAGDGTLVRDILGKWQAASVIHFAGSTVVPESISAPLKYYRNNTCVSRTLIESCVAAGVGQVVFSSTAAVYGVPRRVPVVESAPTEPVSPYGTSKLMTEWMLRDVAATGALKFVALRYFNVAGADEQLRTGQSTPNATHLIKVACETALGLHPEIEIFGTDYDTPDGTCVRDFIHVTDLAAAHVATLRYLTGGGNSTVLNLGYGHGFSVREVLDTLSDEIGQRIPQRLSPRRPGDSPMVVADPSTTRATLDWRPRHDDLRTIVRTAYDWERKFRASVLEAV